MSEVLFWLLLLVGFAVIVPTLNDSVRMSYGDLGHFLESLK